MIPGEYLLGEGDIVANAGRRTLELTVANTGDRPIQIGSHFHFFEVNRALRFDRAQAFGMRLNVPAGTAVRFEPGDEVCVGETDAVARRWAVEVCVGATRDEAHGRVPSANPRASPSAIARALTASVSGASTRLFMPRGHFAPA